MMTPNKIAAFEEYVHEVQGQLLEFRKELRTKNDHQWNAKAQLVFVAEHLDCALRNLNRSLKDDGRK